MSCRLRLELAAGLGVGLAVASLAAQPLSYDAAVAALRSPEARVRLETLRMLERSGYPEAAAPVAELITDRSNEVQRAAIDAELAFFVIEMAPRSRRMALFIEVRGERSTAKAFEQGALGLRPLAVPRQVTDRLAVAIADDDPGVRWEALFALGTLATPPVAGDVAGRLTRMLSDPDPQMRLAGALVAGRLGMVSAGEALIHLLNDPEDRVQLAALEALGDLREARAAVALADRVEYYRRGPAAEASLRAAARIGHPLSQPLFEALAGARDAPLRRFAYEGLGRVGHSGSVALLQQAAAEESAAEARLASQFALQRLGQPALSRIVEALSDRRLARQARDYLLELGGSSVRELEAQLHAGTPAIRAGVADVLGMVGDTATIDRLEALGADPDPGVAEMAVRAADRIRLRLAAGDAGSGPARRP